MGPCPWDPLAPSTLGPPLGFDASFGQSRQSPNGEESTDPADPISRGAKALK